MAKSNSLSYLSIINKLSKKEFAPVYFLMGDESYFIDKISDFAEKNLLTDEEKAFNLYVFYGKDSTMSAIVNAAKQFPMGAPMQVIIVKEAQMLENFDELQFYLEHPLSTTLLMFCHKNGKLDRRLKLINEIEKKGILFVSEKIRDEKIPQWIIDYLSEKQVGIDEKSAQMLADFLGNDLGKLVNELEKLLFTKPPQMKRITSELIEKNIGISKEFNNFELINALSKKNVLKSNQIIRYFAANQKSNPLPVTLSMLYNFFSNLMIYHFLPDKRTENVAKALGINPYFVKDYVGAAQKFSSDKTAEIISAIRHCDAQSKGFNNASADPEDLLTELIYKILH
ncbi:MAG: DNA polymerase III subunit delta [Microbacter sp.]